MKIQKLYNMADTAYDNDHINQNNLAEARNYHVIRDTLTHIATNDDLKHVKTVFKRLSLEKNDQIVNHLSIISNTEDSEGIEPAKPQPFVFCWEKQLKKLEKLKNRLIKKNGDQLLEQITILVKPEDLDYEISIDCIDEAILRYVIANQKLENIKLTRRDDCLIISSTITKENEFNNFNSDASFESDNGPNRFANMNIAEAIEDVLDNQIKTNPDPIQALELVKYDPNEDKYYFGLTPPAYLGNSRITNIRVSIKEHLTNKELNIETSEYEFSTNGLKENTIYMISVELENFAGYKSTDNPIFKIYTHTSSTNTSSFYVTTLNNDNELPEEGPFILNKVSHMTSKLKFSDHIPLKIVDLDIGGNALCLLNTGGILNWGKMIAHKDENTPSSLPIHDMNGLIEEIKEVHIPLTNCLIREISCGKNFCLALACTGEIYSWGMNTYGQLGHGDFYHRPDPTKIKSDKFYIKIKSAYENCYAEADNGDKYIWGRDVSSKWILSDKKVAIMNNPVIHQNSPRKIDFDSKEQIKKIEIGNSLYVFLTLTGTLYTLGDNTYGQLGFDKPDGTELPFCDQPHKLSFDKSIRDVSVGKYHVIIINEDLDIYGFGRNHEHQLKKSNYPLYRSPTLIKSSNKDIDSVFAVNKMSFVKTIEGTYVYLNENRKCDYVFGQVRHKSYGENIICID